MLIQRINDAYLKSFALRNVSAASRLRLFGVLCLFLYASSAFGQDVNLSTTIPANVPGLATKTYYDGAETIGRVGHEAILRRDILHQIKKIAHTQYLEEIEKLPEDEREKHRKEYKEGILQQFLASDAFYSQVLDNHIRKLLFYNDYIVSRPKEQVQEQSKQLEQEFNSKVVPELEEQFNCKSVRDLEKYFEEEIGSNFEQEKRIFLQHTLGELWMGFNLGEEDFTPTLSDLKRYYEANLDVYRTQTQTRWQAMTVYFGIKRSRADALRKLAHMGNAVQNAPTQKQEAMFAQVCRVDSEDPFAERGGYRDWTMRGSLRSKVVEDAIFSEALPVGEMSKILEDPDQGSLTIVRIVEREKERTKNFAEVQEEVREKLINDRKEAMEKKYEEKLSERFSIEIYAITPEERERCFRSANRTETSATGRAIY